MVELTSFFLDCISMISGKLGRFRRFVVDFGLDVAQVVTVDSSVVVNLPLPHVRINFRLRPIHVDFII